MTAPPLRQARGRIQTEFASPPRPRETRRTESPCVLPRVQRTLPHKEACATPAEVGWQLSRRKSLPLPSRLPESPTRADRPEECRWPAQRERRSRLPPPPS